MGRLMNLIFGNKQKPIISQVPIFISETPVAQLTIDELVEEYARWHKLTHNLQPLDWAKAPNVNEAIARSKEILEAARTRNAEILLHLHGKYPNCNYPDPWN